MSRILKENEDLVDNCLGVYLHLENRSMNWMEMVRFPPGKLQTMIKIDVYRD